MGQGLGPYPERFANVLATEAACSPGTADARARGGPPRVVVRGGRGGRVQLAISCTTARGATATSTAATGTRATTTTSTTRAARVTGSGRQLVRRARGVNLDHTGARRAGERERRGACWGGSDDKHARAPADRCGAVCRSYADPAVADDASRPPPSQIRRAQLIYIDGDDPRAWPPLLAAAPGLGGFVRHRAFPPARRRSLLSRPSVVALGGALEFAVANPSSVTSTRGAPRSTPTAHHVRLVRQRDAGVGLRRPDRGRRQQLACVRGHVRCVRVRRRRREPARRRARDVWAARARGKAFWRSAICPKNS